MNIMIRILMGWDAIGWDEMVVDGSMIVVEVLYTVPVIRER